MKKVTALILINVFARTGVILHAQNETNHWFFGDYTGLSFSSGSPVPVTGALYTGEGVTSASDPITGNLFFYSDGVNVWDNTNTVMPHGTGLLGNISSTMSALAVPQPGHNGIYYLFTTDCMENAGAGGFNYSIVDMSAHGGLGDVISVNNLLFAPSSEVNHAVKHANCTDYWIVAREWFTNNYKAYLLTASGLSAPVVTTIGLSETFYDAGQGKFSPDGSKYAIANTGSGIVQLFDFNTTTGIFSNPITLYNGSVLQTYGLSFSPDNSKLYAQGGPLYGNVYQWDVSSGDSATITASKTFIATGTPVSQFQLGRDHKLYIANDGYNFLSVINDPNMSGLACNYDSAGITLPGGCEFGLPAFPENYFNTSTACPYVSYIFARGNGTCYNDSSGKAWAELSNISSPYTISWSPGGMTTDTIAGLPAGTYYATVTDSGGTVFIDSVLIDQPATALTAIIFTTSDPICPGTSITLSGIGTGGVMPYIYHWATTPGGITSSDTTGHMNSDTTSYTYSPESSNTISLTVTDLYNCTATAEINITTLPLRVPEIKGPLFSCNGLLTTLVVDSVSYYTDLLWSNASTNDSISVLSGIYILTATNPDGCKGKDTVQVVDAVPTVSITGASDFCRGSDLILTADPAFLSGANYLWSNAATTQSTGITTSGLYTVHVTYNNGCSASDSILVSALDAPHANFSFSPSSSGAFTPILFTDQSTISTGTITAWYWDFGDGSAGSISVLQNPIHSFATDGMHSVMLAVQSNNGCWDTVRFDYEVSASDIILPNVFTPNNDGKNDYLSFKNLEFFPGTGIEVYNRWGEKIYSNPDYHNDWNGADQKDGVYYFVLSGSLLKETKTGFVQLIK